MTALQAAAPTLVNVAVFVGVFTALGRAGLLDGRGFRWALVWPLVLLLNAPLHEASHALAGLAQGLRILEFHAWGLAGNYVRFTGNVTVPILAAPYLRDFISFALTAAVLSRLSPRRRGLWLILLMTGMLVPLWNTGLECASYVFGRSLDLRMLSAALGPAPVLVALGLAFAAYLLGTLRIVRGAEARGIEPRSTPRAKG